MYSIAASVAVAIVTVPFEIRLLWSGASDAVPLASLASRYPTGDEVYSGILEASGPRSASCT